MPGQMPKNQPGFGVEEVLPQPVIPAKSRPEESGDNLLQDAARQMDRDFLQSEQGQNE